jgi:hypothetical protein
VTPPRNLAVAAHPAAAARALRQTGRSRDLPADQHGATVAAGRPTTGPAAGRRPPPGEAACPRRIPHGPATPPAPLERLDRKPPVVPSVEGGWLLELRRRPGGRFEISDMRVGGIVRVEGQAVLRHPAGHVVQPVTVAMRDDGTGELGRASWESLGRRGRRTGLPWIRAKRRQRTRPRGHMRAHVIYPARDKLSRAR